MIKVIQIGDPVLRTIAKEILIDKITSSETQKVIKDMKQALAENEDGIAIAAPQIGVSLRIFIISRRFFLLDEEGKLLPEITSDDLAKHKDLVFINPKITNRSKKTQWLTEGCLSVRGVYGKVKRSEKVTIKAVDENGKLFTRGASGLLAQTIQHENDHLNGILFCDKAKDLEEIDMSNDKNTA
ncbi:MAG: peptide deformylase [Candidatus Pacebacteria bacterium]|nr:peptide deformylase [Candidatus Paceibacterota bacterium]